jgi:serine/threonine protein kinase/Tfp pilus assembly protein PilF
LRGREALSGFLCLQLWNNTNASVQVDKVTRDDNLCPKDQSADGEMAEKFLKLKEADAGNTFNSQSTTDPSDGKKADLSIDLLQGAVIGGIYRINKLIGKGGMGEVYLAEHLTLAKTCAVKLIPPHRVTDSSWQRFQNEAKSIAGLDHINLVKVWDLGVHEGCLPYYAMEYIDGQILADMLETYGSMPLNVVLDVFMQICDGIDYAHKTGLVHRDLKPANIMLVKSQAGKLSVKVLDFGLVKLTQNDRHKQSLTLVGTVIGSPYYMSPEQCAGGAIDNRSDIYSVGCTMFESLTGRPPFIGGSPVETVHYHQTTDPPSLESIVGPHVFPQSMEVVLAKLLRKNPDQRYQTLLELRGDLERVARGEDIQPSYASISRPLQADAELYVTESSQKQATADDEEEAEAAAAEASNAFFGPRKTIVAASAVTLLAGLATIGFLAARHASVKSTSLSTPQGSSSSLKPVANTQSVDAFSGSAASEFRRAQQMLLQKHGLQARSILTRLCRSKSASPEMLCLLADTYVAEGDDVSEEQLALCDQILQRALQLDPEWGNAYKIQAQVSNLREKYDLAVSQSTKALTCQKQDPKAWLQRTFAYKDLGKYQEALADITVYTTKFDHSDYMYFLKAEILLALNRIDDAVIAYRAALAAHYKDFTVYQIVMCLEKEGKFQEGIDEVSTLVKANPRDAEAYQVRARLEGRAKKNDAAIADYTAAIGLEPTPRFYKERAALLKLQGRYHAAAEDIKQAALSDPYGK